jgi:hypothetical protein
VHGKRDRTPNPLINQAFYARSCEILQDTVRLKLLANEDRADFTIAANHRFLIVHGG